MTEFFTRDLNMNAKDAIEKQQANEEQKQQWFIAYCFAMHGAITHGGYNNIDAEATSHANAAMTTFRHRFPK